MVKTRIITRADEIVRLSESLLAEGKRIGFVPTMGALHRGHASLIEKAKSDCEVVIVSVFVNPTQFNDSSDLEKYPRTFDEDKSLLVELGVDVMFYPTTDEIYPNNDATQYDLDGLDMLMEGPNRPGHFNGVVQVVTRLFDLTHPTKAYFGQKDFQQLAIIKHMTTKLGYDVEVVGCPTVREPNGLAMSSRNMRLTEAGKTKAANIFAILQELKADIRTKGIPDAQHTAVEKLTNVEGLELEYLELVECETLNRASDHSDSIQACLAAWVEGVRLIDNVQLK